SLGWYPVSPPEWWGKPFSESTRAVAEPDGPLASLENVPGCPSGIGPGPTGLVNPYDISHPFDYVVRFTRAAWVDRVPRRVLESRVGRRSDGLERRRAAGLHRTARLGISEALNTATRGWRPRVCHGARSNQPGITGFAPGSRFWISGPDGLGSVSGRR